MKPREMNRLSLEKTILAIAGRFRGIEGGAGPGELGFWFRSVADADRFKHEVSNVVNGDILYDKMGIGEGVRLNIPEGSTIK